MWGQSGGLYKNKGKANKSELNCIGLDMRAVVHVHCTLLESILILGVGMRHVGLVFALMVLWFLSTVSAAQTGASLSGVVTDQTGAALRDVAVTVKNVDTGATRKITTDGGGHYQASGLPLGRFEIRAAKQGFADETRTGISLAVGQEAAVDIKMQRSTPDACASGHEFATTDCTLTWHGITLYGAYDVGVGWVSHGLPENGHNYEGESLVNRNGYQHRFLIAPNNLQQTGLGIRGKEESTWLVRCVQRFHWHQSAPPTCSPSVRFRASCAGTLNEGSL